MKLYGSLLSPYVMRPVLVARAKGADIAVETFDGGIKCDAYLALNPMGKMPLFVDGDFALPESKTIADYLDAVLPGPALVPAEPKAAARVRLIERIVDVYAVPELGGLFRGREDPAAAGAAAAALATSLRNLDHFRTDADVFLAGDTFTVADAALMPLAFFVDALGQRDAVLAGVPRIAAWWDRAKASELGTRQVAEQAAGLKAMLAARAAEAKAAA